MPGDGDDEFPNPVAQADGAEADDEQLQKGKMVKELQTMAFGTKQDIGDLEDEDAIDARIRDQWFGILHPDAHTRGFYDLFQLCIMLYLGWLLPIRLAFTKTASGPTEVILDLMIDASVWTDMFLQTKMCSIDKKTKKLIHDRKVIQKEYLKTWFFVDFFSVVPADQILLLIGSLLAENGAPEWGGILLEYSVSARLMRLLRLVRLAKIRELLNMEKVTQHLYMVLHHLGITKLQISFYFRVFFLVALIMASGHFLGCIWLTLGRYNVLQQLNPEGWMVSAYEQQSIEHTRDFISCIGGGFSAQQWNEKHGQTCWDIHNSSCFTNRKCHQCVPIPDSAPYDVDCGWIKNRAEVAGGTGILDGVGASEDEQYLSAFYFSLVTVTTVGYGDILPETPAEKRFVILCIVTGAFLYAYVIGDFTLLLSNLSQERDEYDSKMRSINDLLSYIDCPPDVRRKVQDYYDFKYLNKEGKPDLTGDLPTALQVELVQHRYGKLITKVPFFESLHKRAVADLCQQMRSFTVAPDDAIIETGDWNDELIILNKGTAKTVDSDGVTVFDAGSFWGEMQFLGLQRQRTMTVTANTYCELGSLAPGCIRALTYGSEITHRLKVYATLRQEYEVKLSAGEKIDKMDMFKELAKRLDEEADQFVPTGSPSLAAISSGNSEDSGDLYATVKTALEDMQIAHRQTEAQVSLLASKTDAQIGQLLGLVQSLSEQVAGVHETTSSLSEQVTANTTKLSEQVAGVHNTTTSLSEQVAAVQENTSNTDASGDASRTEAAERPTGSQDD